MSANVPALRSTQEIALLSEQQLALLKKTYAPTATDEEFEFYLQVAQAADLNPFTQPPEIHFFKIGGKPVMPVGIDGLRRHAAESGEYAGQAGPFWSGPDGVWKDLWLGPGPPFAAKVGVYRFMPNGEVNPTPTWGVALWSEFSKDVTQPVGKFWKDRGAHMLAKCAEAQAFRKACPGLTKKMQAAGAQVIDAEYLIYKAEQVQRDGALPQKALVGDVVQELYGAAPPNEEGTQPDETGGEEKAPPAKWTQEGVGLLKAAVANSGLGSKKWRELLGLPEGAEKSDLEALGTPEEVVKLLGDALDKAVAGEPTDQAGLGF